MNPKNWTPLARPMQMGLKRPLQKSYPHIHGLYLLVRASGLTCVEGTDKKPLLVVDGAVYHAWQGLNPTERYCTLLETWLLRGNPEIIGERGRGRLRIPDTFTDLPWFFRHIPDAGLPIAGEKEAEDSIRCWPGRTAIRAGAALDELASAILEAVELDDDHLHMFAYRNRFGVTERIHHFEHQHPR